MDGDLIELPSPPPTREDAYTWRVYYDGENASLGEYDRAEGVSFTEAIAGNVTEIALLSTSPEREIRHIVQVPPGVTPVFFRRRALLINPLAEEGNGQYRASAHCIGWRRDETGEEVYQFILEHGVSILTSDLQAI